MQSAQECKWAFSGDWRRARAPNYSNGGGLMECLCLSPRHYIL